MFKNKNIILNLITLAALALVLLVSLRPAYVSSSPQDFVGDEHVSARSFISIESTPIIIPDIYMEQELSVDTEAPDEPDIPVHNPVETAPGIDALDLTDSLTLSISIERSDGNESNSDDESVSSLEPTLDVLLDRDVLTKLTFENDTQITISSTEEVHSIYLVWDTPPKKWHLIGYGTQHCGENGFVHEYVNLAAPSTELTISIPDNDAALCDIYAFSEGSPPQWVQTWQPPLSQADMLLIPTHFEDEYLYFVGLLPYYAGELGYRIQIAFMTNHWNEPPRTHEMLDGLWFMGVRHYPVIGEFDNYDTDSIEDARELYGQEKFIDYQVELLRRFKPQVVISHDLNGEYGHGAHMLAASSLQTAVENAADSTYHTASYELYGVWDTPKLYLHLYWENTISMNWDISLSRFDGATAAEIAVAGFDYYQIKLHPLATVPSIGPSGHVFGLVRSTVGADSIGGDVFENIFTG